MRMTRTMSPSVSRSPHFAGRLGARFREAVVERVAEELLGAVEAPRLQQLLGADHAKRVEQLGPDDVLAALAAIERQVRDPRMIAARGPRNERRILIVGVGAGVEHACGRLQALEHLREAGGAHVVDGPDLPASPGETAAAGNKGAVSGGRAGGGGAGPGPVGAGAGVGRVGVVLPGFPSFSSPGRVVGAAHDFDEAVRANPLRERGAHFVGGQVEIALRHVHGFVERQPDLRAGEQHAGNRILARLLQRHLPQQQRLCLVQLRGRDVLGLHGAQVARDQVARLRHVRRIAIRTSPRRRCASCPRRGCRRRCRRARHLAQVVIQARRVEAAAEHVVAKLQRVVVGIEPRQADFLRQRDRRLDGAPDPAPRNRPDGSAARAEASDRGWTPPPPIRRKTSERWPAPPLDPRRR